MKLQKLLIRQGNATNTLAFTDFDLGAASKRLASLHFTSLHTSTHTQAYRKRLSTSQQCVGIGGAGVGNSVADISNRICSATHNSHNVANDNYTRKFCINFSSNGVLCRCHRHAESIFNWIPLLLLSPPNLLLFNFDIFSIFMCLPIFGCFQSRKSNTKHGHACASYRGRRLPRVARWQFNALDSVRLLLRR